jgi:hypothetical protein
MNRTPPSPLPHPGASRAPRPATPWLTGILGLLLAAGCSGDSSDQEPPPPTAPEPGFSLALDADSVELYRGDSVEVRVRIQGDPGFQGPVTLELQGAGSGLSAVAPSGPVSGTEAWIRLALDQGASVGARILGIQGQAGNRTAQATLRIGVPQSFPNEPEWSYAPGVRGEVRQFMVGPEPIWAEVYGDVVVFQGDMILGTVAEVESWATLGAVWDPEVATAYAHDPVAGAAICLFNHFRCERWTDGIMGYAFADDWGSPEANTEMRSRILEAMAIWESLTPIRFVPRSSGERVVFRNSEGCSSFIGRRVFTGFDPQTINLSTTCQFPTIVHEIAHAVGIHHEQSRLDRDDHVRILWENIQSGKAHNFDRMWSGHGADAGPYNVRSIMHYGCWAFSDNDEPTILPRDPDVSCDDFRGNELTDTDILGVYTLYPPSYVITGAQPLQAGTRFELSLVFAGPQPRDQLIRWTTNITGGIVGTGPNFILSSQFHGAGAHTVSAQIVVAGEVVASRSITLLATGFSTPQVDLGPDRRVSVGRPVTLVASVSDSVDGGCPPGTCQYAWSPAPTEGSPGGASATYRFLSEGVRAIRVDVTNSVGGVGTGEVRLDAAYDAPEVSIEAPAFGSTFPAGSSTLLRGSAADVNAVPDPAPVACESLVWESSNPTDTFPGGTQGCEVTVTFGEAGTRSLTLRASTAWRSGTATTSAVVVGCDGNCPPIVDLTIVSSPNFGQTGYAVPVPHPGYHFDRSIHFRGVVVDEDTPPDSPVSYRWLMDPPCTPPGTCEPTVLATGTASLLLLTGSVTLNHFWEPSAWWNPWPTCITEPLEFRISLEVTDSRGARTTATRPLMVACPLTQ